MLYKVNTIINLKILINNLILQFRNILEKIDTKLCDFMY